MTTTATTTRTGNVLTVNLPDGTTYTTKGKRAAAAVAVSVGQWANDGRWCVGVHGTIAAAHTRARTYSTPAAPGGDYWTHTHVVPVS